MGVVVLSSYKNPKLTGMQMRPAKSYWPTGQTLFKSMPVHAASSVCCRGVLFSDAPTISIRP